jgi:hypothetical protein
MRRLNYLATAIAALYLLPSLASAGYWAAQERPANWRAADWSASGVLPSPAKDARARVAVLAARTGGLKGAFAVHSWLVVKRAGAADYDRYDVVGWGNPVRRNGYPADGRWYSNVPEIVWQAEGDKAEALIPKIEAAIAAYPHAAAGSYRLWPGPNSNTFVAGVMRAVPEIDAVLPPNAVGRDYLPGGGFVAYDPQGDLHLTLYGLAGLSVGVKSGVELHLLGLVAGIDVMRPGVKIPALGRIGV